ncbi:antibiotic biosynthesis monooxygenase [Sporosarcina koreensis]|uniref:antibiotic biosynthesis monooxygenase n=1 Tax=Sporosarcina koreensis TaxID=334735 RepID=UPI0005901B8B|nr:antibiotic biosynthesis monooxygenase [Sporosarcina koreensis]
MTQMIAVNVISIEKGRAKEVADRFANPKSVHTFPGFIRMEVLQKENLEDHDELHICTTWNEEADFKNWLESRANGKAHGEQQEKKPAADGEGKSNPILGAELSTYTVVHRHLPAE